MELECLRCNHKWWPRMNKKPKACPACKSYRWETEKKPKKKED